MAVMACKAIETHLHARSRLDLHIRDLSSAFSDDAPGCHVGNEKLDLHCAWENDGQCLLHPKSITPHRIISKIFSHHHPLLWDRCNRVLAFKFGIIRGHYRQLSCAVCRSADILLKGIVYSRVDGSHLHDAILRCRHRKFEGVQSKTPLALNLLRPRLILLAYSNNNDLNLGLR